MGCGLWTPGPTPPQSGGWATSTQAWRAPIPVPGPKNLLRSGRPARWPAPPTARRAPWQGCSPPILVGATNPAVPRSAAPSAPATQRHTPIANHHVTLRLSSWWDWWACVFRMCLFCTESEYDVVYFWIDPMPPDLGLLYCSVVEVELYLVTMGWSTVHRRGIQRVPVCTCSCSCCFFSSEILLHVLLCVIVGTYIWATFLNKCC